MSLSTAEDFFMSIINASDFVGFQVFLIIFIFLSFFILIVFSSLLGVWIINDRDLFFFFILIVFLLLVPVLFLIVVIGFENSSSFWINSDYFISSISYGFNFIETIDFFARTGILNEFPLFKGFWFEIIGGVDSLSVIFIFMVHVVALMTIAFLFLYFSGSLFSTKRSVKDLESLKLSIFSVLIMSFFLDLLFLTTNLVIMFILAELTLLPLSFLMLKDNTVFWRSPFSRFSLVKSSLSSVYLEEKFENKRPLAFYYLIFFTIVSGGLGLFSISLIYLSFGTTSLVLLSSVVFSFNFLDFVSLTFLDLKNSIFFSEFLSDYLNNYTLSVVSLLLLIFWISVKVPLAPVHIWLPKAHVEGSTESSMLLAGIILKITVYILIRVLSLPFFVPLFVDFKAFFLSIAVLTALVGAFGALLTTDLKRIVAYSSVSHMGIIMSAGFFIVSSPIALYPFIVLLLTHTIVSTAMFMMVGCVYKSRYASFVSRNKLVYGGLLYIFPSFFLFGIILFANLNIPLTMGFTGELGTLVAVVQSGLTVGFLLCLAAFILLLPMVSLLGQVLMGPIRSTDYFFFKEYSGVTGFYLKSVFNHLTWSKNFLNFYYNQYLYFFSTVFVVIIFGFFPFLVSNYLESFSLQQSDFFNFIQNRVFFSIK